MDDKIKHIKILLSDVDGVMTDGCIWLDAHMQWKRKFNVMDGMGLKRLMSHGIQVGIITASDSDDVRERFRFLEVNHFFDKSTDKKRDLNQIIETTGFSLDEVAYIGDDLADLPVIHCVGFGVAVPNALEEVRNQADLITQRSGGCGAVRELCEIILQSQKK